MVKVCLVSAGMMHPKKGGGRFRYMHRYLNYGLLGLSSAVADYWPVIHGNFSPPDEFLTNNPELSRCKAVLLSVPSFFALEWSRSFLSELKIINPECDIHVGGRWVIDKSLSSIRHYFPSDARFHRGFGEVVIPDLARHYGAELSSDFASHGSAMLNYARLKYREEFHASIEVSRGCGLGCHFCEEALVPLGRMKSPDRILDEFETARAVFGYDPKIYLESSFFAPSENWTKRLQEVVESRSGGFRWRTESRVDALSERKIAALAASGMKVIDLGLESASPRQLLAMGKSRDPDAYLKKASSLIAACHQNGVAAKLNVLLYPGESYETIEETRSFLASHEGLYKGVSAYPVLVFGFESAILETREEYSRFDGCGILPSGTPGVWDVNLSRDISSVDAKAICSDISKTFMSSANYYELKSFGYLNPSYTREEFLIDLADIDDRDRPCGN